MLLRLNGVVELKRSVDVELGQDLNCVTEEALHARDDDVESQPLESSRGFLKLLKELVGRWVDLVLLDWD